MAETIRSLMVRFIIYGQHEKKKSKLKLEGNNKKESHEILAI